MSSGVLARVAAAGAVTQAAVPALYAWAITVRPLAFARGAAWPAKACALTVLAALAAAPLAERRWAGSGRRVLLVLVLGASAGAWALAPRGITLGPTATLLGALGWGLFAFALAGPVVRRPPPVLRAGASVDDDAFAVVPLDVGTRPRPRGPRSWGDGLYLAAGAAAAAALAVTAWDAPTPERAVLVRLTAVACGVFVLDAAASLAVARHVPRRARPLRARWRPAWPWALALGLVTAVGLALLGAGVF